MSARAPVWDAALIVRRIAGRDVRELAVAAAGDGLHLGRSLTAGGLMAWAPVSAASARDVLVDALRLDALVDAAPGPAVEVAADALERALLLGGGALVALAVEAAAASPTAGEALAGLVAAVAVEVHRADGARTGLAWLDAGRAGSLRIMPGGPGRVALHPASAAALADAARGIAGTLRVAAGRATL